MSLCQCGCGLEAPICTHTNTKEGIKKGEYRRFIYGHQFTLGSRIGRWNMKTQEERFLEKVYKTPNCWFWIGGINTDGYGSFDQNRAHRIAYTLFKGPVLKRQFVCHTCDTALCVNPEHLFLSTVKGNVADMISKGRGRANCFLRDLEMA